MPPRNGRHRPARSRPRASAPRHRACRARCARAPARRAASPSARSWASPIRTGAQGGAHEGADRPGQQQGERRRDEHGDRKRQRSQRQPAGGEGRTDEHVSGDDDRADHRRREPRPVHAPRAVGGRHVEHSEDRDVRRSPADARAPSAAPRRPRPAPRASGGDHRRTARAPAKISGDQSTREQPHRLDLRSSAVPCRRP